MKQFLMGSWLPGCLAAFAIAGSASEVSAFQEREQIIIQPNVERQAEQRTTLTGEFTSQHQGMVTIAREGQNPRSFRTTDQTEVIINDRPARLEDLRKGDRIRVTEGVGGIVLRIEAQREPGQRPAQDTERPAQETRQPAQESERPAQESERPEQQIERRGAGFRGETGQAQRTERLEDSPNGQQQAGNAWLGVLLRETEGQQGVEVARIYPSGPASRAGLFSGDVLLQIDNQSVNSPDEAARILSQAQPNKQVEIVVKRGQREQTLTAMLGDRRVFLGEERRRPELEQQEGEDEFEGGTIPDHAMMLEQHRRFAEQHERIERKLDQVLTEMENLRKQLGADPANPTARPEDRANPPGTRPRNPLDPNPRNGVPERPEQND